MPSIPPRSDRENAARYPEVANNLRIGRDWWNDYAAALVADTALFDTYAVPLLNRVRPLIEQIAAVYADLADGLGGAQELADTYRDLLDRRFEVTA